MNDGAVTPTPLVQSLGLGQLNCRRLWSRDGSIHDGFMGLVSCLDQLGLQVLCVQETQSLPMSSLPVDQPFRYDGPVGSHGREAGFLFHSSIVATPIPGTPDSQSLRWRFISGSLCVCSFYAPHAGIPSDTRIQFWRTLAASVHCVSQLHSGASLLLAGDSNIWFPFFQLGRSRQADAPLLPIVQEILQSHSLVFRNPTDLPTHRCGAALDIILSSPSLSTQITVHSGLNWCPLRLFVVPCSLLTTCCALVALTFTRLLCLLIQPIRPCPVCRTGPLWLLLAITSLVHSLAFLSVLRLWILSLTLSRGSSVGMLRITLVVAPGPAHAQGSLSGGMMRAATLWLLATAHGVTFAAPGLLRIRLVSASSVNSFKAQFVPPGPASGTSGLVL